MSEPLKRLKRLAPAAVLVSLGLAACGGDNSQETTTEHVPAPIEQSTRQLDGYLKSLDPAAFTTLSGNKVTVKGVSWCFGPFVTAEAGKPGRYTWTSDCADMQHPVSYWTEDDGTVMMNSDVAKHFPGGAEMDPHGAHPVDSAATIQMLTRIATLAAAQNR